MIHEPELKDFHVDRRLITVQSLRQFLCSQEVPYLLRNSWMVYMPNRCLACIYLEETESLMEANPWDKGFRHFAQSAQSGTFSKLVIQVLHLLTLYPQREIHPTCFRWKTHCLSPLTMEKA